MPSTEKLLLIEIKEVCAYEFKNLTLLNVISTKFIDPDQF